MLWMTITESVCAPGVQENINAIKTTRAIDLNSVLINSASDSSTNSCVKSKLDICPCGNPQSLAISFWLAWQYIQSIVARNLNIPIPHTLIASKIAET